MKEIIFTRRFERDFRRLKKTLPRRALDYETLEYVFLLLQSGQALATSFALISGRGSSVGQVMRKA